MTAILGLNHLTLAVSNLPRSLEFYRDILGATITAQWDMGAYLDLGGIWLCLALGPVSPRQDYSHIAFSCNSEDFDKLRNYIRTSCTEWKTNRSEGASLYFLDPDGHQLELHLGDMDSRLAHYRQHPELGVIVYD